MNMSKIFFLIFPLITFCISPVLSEEIKIGATLPLTGSLAHVGEDIRRGMQLAIEENKESKIKYQIIFEDNQHQQAQAVSSAQKLLDVNHVDILITLWDMADVVAPLAERKKVPHLSIRWNPHIAEKYQYTVTFESTYLTYDKSQVELLKALDIKTVGLITEESQGWLLAAEGFKPEADKAGIKILIEKNYIADGSDFGTIVTSVLKAKPEMIVINGHQPQLDIILKRIKEQNPDQKITGYFEAVEPPALVEGLPFAAQFKVEPWFSEKFKKRYGENFKVRAPHGYDLMNIIFHSYAEAGGKVGGDKFLSEVEKLKDYPGATGKLSINKTKNIENICVWRVVKNGEFVDFKSIQK
jgi:branched-chain amino acid transport system substrate-binding protein